MEGNHEILSNNYKATFSDSIFTLTFDSFDNNKYVQNDTITINFKEVLSIEHYTSEYAQIHGDPVTSEMIADILGFFIEEEILKIPIYFDYDGDVTKRGIYKDLKILWKYYLKS